MTIHALTNCKLTTKPAKTSLLGGHFIYRVDTTQGTLTPSSANIVQNVSVNSQDVTDQPSQWGYNTHIGANGIKLRKNEIDLSKWTDTGLTFYNPSTTGQGNRAMELTGSNLTFYASDGITSQAVFGGTGAQVRGAITATSLTIDSDGTTYDGMAAINISGYDIEITSDSTGVISPDTSIYLYPHLYHNGVEIEYLLSVDTEVDNSKTYYTRSGTAGNYTYTIVTNPTGNPKTNQYYEHIDYTNFIWYQDDVEPGTAGDANNQGRYLATYGYNYRVTYDFDDGAVSGGTQVQTRTIDPSKYITKINDTGITIHPEVWANQSSYIQLTGSGMELFNNSGISIAKYGEDIRLGNENEGKLLITAGGQGHTYEDAGTYIVDSSGKTVALFGANVIRMAVENSDAFSVYRDGASVSLNPKIPTIWKIEKGKTKTIVIPQEYQNDVSLSGVYGISIAFKKSPDTAVGSGWNFTYGTAVQQQGDPPRLDTNYDGAFTFICTNTSATTDYYAVISYKKTGRAPCVILGTTDAEQFGAYSVTEGRDSIASGNYSHAEANSTASGDYSHAEGSGTTASGNRSHAEGVNTNALAFASHAEGWATTASGFAGSHAEGYQSTASGEYGSHAEGSHSTASGDSSHAQNTETIAQRKSQTTIGEYNIADTSGADETVRGDYSLIIGNGNGISGDPNERSNALTVDWDGNVEAAGQVYQTVEQVTPSITTSVGTLNSATLTRCGNLRQLTFTISNSTATAVGSNVYTGKLTNTADIPITNMTGVSYYTSSCLCISITNTGDITVRVTGAQLAASSSATIGILYIAS